MKIGSSYPRVYFEMLFVGFTLILGLGLARAFLPILANELDPSGTLVGYVMSAWFLARVFIELPSGLFSDRIGRRTLFVLGIALAAVGSLMCALAPSIYFLIVGRAIWGFGAAFFFLNNTAIVIDLFESKVRGRALGTFQGIEFIGSLIGTPIGALIAGIVGYNAVFYITFVLISLSFLLSFMSKGLKEVAGRPVESTLRPSLRESLVSLRRWDVLVVDLISFARMLIMNGLMSTVFQLYLYEHLGFAVGLIGIVAGARTVGFTVATIISGYLSDRLGRKPVIIMGLLIEAPCFFAYTIFPSFELILLIGIIDGLGGGLVSTTLTVFLSEIVQPKFRGVSIGLYRTFMDVGGIVGPILFMLIATAVNLRTSFYVGAVILVIMAGLMALIKKDKL